MQAQLDMKLQMARSFAQIGRTEQAEELIRQVLGYDPGHVNAAIALAMLYTQQQRHAEAVDILNRAFDSRPDDAGAMLRLANIYKNWGRFDEAKACYRRAIALDVESAPQAHLALAMTCGYSEYDDDVRLMEEAYDASGAGSASRRYLGFALGKVFDDLNDYDRAFSCFQEANRIVAAAHDPAMAELRQSHERIKGIMNPEFFRRRENSGIADATPIFVTGMPRSGTTLVEQILASHPQVHGAGELEKFDNLTMGIRRSHSLHQPFPVGFDELDPEVLREYARHYLNDLKVLAGDRPHATDKSISNYIFLGLIRVMFPDAKIVLCRRDPRDVGLSIFQKDFGYPFYWSYKLSWIGEFYRLFDGIIAHWARCFPGRIHVLQYEELIGDPDRHIRALLAHCGLEFDPACLAFHETDRVVKTASRAQVRKPIYRGSAGRWKNYEKHLGPLLTALETDSP